MRVGGGLREYVLRSGMKSLAATATTAISPLVEIGIVYVVIDGLG